MSVTEALISGAIWILAAWLCGYAGWRAGRAHQLRLDAARMRSLCDEIVSFADGELPPNVAGEFREHLKRCPDCQRQLPEELRLNAQLSSAKPREGDVQ
jgi:anti-sigma factor RsiW